VNGDALLLVLRRELLQGEYMIPGDGSQVFICSECITRCAKRLYNMRLASMKCAGMR
jgi:hypothetical protein